MQLFGKSQAFTRQLFVDPCSENAPVILFPSTFKVRETYDAIFYKENFFDAHKNLNNRTNECKSFQPK